MTRHDPITDARTTPMQSPAACRAPFLLTLALLTGCGTNLPVGGLQVTHAFDNTASTRLGRIVEQAASGHDQTESGFRLVSDGMEAFLIRLALIELADRSLDLQYYIFSPDVTGKLIARQLLQAADRGVRVRLLLDDLGDKPEDADIAALSAHPNIDLRIFNPTRRRQGLGRLVEMVGSFWRINRRMHNKLLIADNQVMMTGGRNIAEAYFSYRGLDFQDIDVVGAGPISQAGSKSFDAFWNSGYALPLQDPVDTPPPEGALAALRGHLDGVAETERDSPYVQAVKESALAGQMREHRFPLTWGRGTLLFDPPGKVGTGKSPDPEAYLGTQLSRFAQASERQLLISSAYFVPGDAGVGLFASLEQRGVQIKVLTNSLASTDVIAVHGHYARYRAPLLRAGVDLWELRRSAAQEKRTFWFKGSSQASLHAKTLVFDDDAVFVGTINLDPRSVVKNTEVGVLIQSPEMARQVTRLFRTWVAPDYAYRVRLSEKKSSVRWETLTEGGESVLTQEPDASAWLRFKAWLLSLLPIESQV